MEIFQKLKIIQKMCSEHRSGCDGCIYKTPSYGCVIRDVTYELVKVSPMNWDMEYLKRCIDGVD